MRRECRERFPSHRGLAIPTCITARAWPHVPWCMSGSLTSGFLWNRWRSKRSRHSRRMRNQKFYVSGKRPMAAHVMSRWQFISNNILSSYLKTKNMYCCFKRKWNNFHRLLSVVYSEHGSEDIEVLSDDTVLITSVSTHPQTHGGVIRWYRPDYFGNFSPPNSWRCYQMIPSRLHR